MKKVLRNSFLYLFVLFNFIYLIKSNFNILNFNNRIINVTYDNQEFKLPLGSNFKELKNRINAKNDDIDDEYIIPNNETFFRNFENQNKISINSANIDDLVKLPGIGDKTALKIIDYREKYGKFLKIEDIKNVSGIGDKKYEKIKEFISI